MLTLDTNEGDFDFFTGKAICAVGVISSTYHVAS